MIAARRHQQSLLRRAAQQCFQQQPQSSAYHTTAAALKPRRPRKGSSRPGSSTSNNAANAAGAPTEATTAASRSQPPKDAHQLAQERILASPDTRIAGTEAIQALTPQQRMRNVGLATFLVGFVGGVWWYSMQAVGRAEADEVSLRAEAEEARGAAERELMQQREAEELAELEVTMANLAEAEAGGELIDVKDADITVAVAAPDAIAREEEERNLAARRRAAGGSDGSGRPLWKKVVFFWRRE